MQLKRGRFKALMCTKLIKKYPTFNRTFNPLRENKASII